MYKVFLADDEIWVTIGLKKLIEKSNMPFRVIGEATNGVVALEEIENKKPDVIFTDIRMPGMDGLSLIKRLQEKRCDAKIVLISGYAQFEYAQKGLQLRAFDYLLKPVELEQLKQVLQELIQQFEREGKEAEPYVEEVLNPSRVQCVIKEIQDNYERNITLADLAERYNVSSGYLSVRLKEELGLSFSEYITSKRIHKAKELLEDESLSIQMIAERVGYKDYFYFTKVFKKVVGLTPSKYRKFNNEKGKIIIDK